MSANLPINWADKKNSPLLADFIAKYGAEYCMTAEEINQLRDAVNEMAVIQQSVFLGSAEPASVPTGTGRAYWIAIAPGTYVNHGGVVVAANEIAFIIRDVAGAFSISKTALDLSGYAKIEILNESIDGLDYGIEKQISGIFQTFPSTFGYITLGGHIQGDGTDQSWLHTDFLRIEKGSVIDYSGTETPNNVLQVAFYDINKVFVSGVAGGADGSVIVPIGVYYVRFCSLSTVALSTVISSKIRFSLKQEFENLDKNTKQISGAFQTFTSAFGYTDLGGHIQGDGTDSDWLHTDFLRIENGSVINYAGTETPNNVLQVAFYDINKVFVSGVAGGADGSVVVPIGVYYVRFCSLSDVALSSAINFIQLITLKQAIKEKISVSDVQNILDFVNLKPSKNYNYDINHFIDYGQSLGQGDWEPAIVSNIQKYNSLMFTGGMRVWENRSQGTIYNALVPAIETSFTYTEGETVVGAVTRGETPCSGMADKIVELIMDEDGFSYTDQQYQILVSAPGMGGTSIGALSNVNGIYYIRLLRDVTNGKRLAEESGKTYCCPAVTWIQGEADVYGNMSQVDYYNSMESLFNNLNNDIKAITGQIDDVNFFLYQTQSFDWYYGGKFTYPDVPLAQLQISLDKPNVHLATPIYHLPLLANDCHFTAIGSKWFGGYFGIAYKRVIIDKNPFRPINLISKKVIGNNIYLKFEAPVYPLKFDTINVPDRGVSKGFQIREVSDRSQNSYLNIITNVEINKFDTIKITCSSNPVGKKLTYAINGTSVTDTSSGNLRDSQDIKFLFKNAVSDSVETSHDMYNWCPLFETLL